MKNCLTKDLGKKFWGDRTFKPYPACRGTHGPIDCALDIVQRTRRRSRQHREGHAVYARWRTGRRVEPTLGDRRLPPRQRHLQLPLHHRHRPAEGSVRPEHFTEQAIRDPKLTEFIAKIDFANLPEGKKGVALTVRTKDGNEYEAESRDRSGNIAGNPLTRDELLAKFWDNVEFAHKHAQSDAQRRCSSYWRTWKTKTASAR